jgi:hypothetical protein
MENKPLEWPEIDKLKEAAEKFKEAGAEALLTMPQLPDPETLAKTEDLGEKPVEKLEAAPGTKAQDLPPIELLDRPDIEIEFVEPPDEFFAHSVMVMVTVKARNQTEAQVQVEAMLDLCGPVAPWENARVVVPPRKVWKDDVCRD